MSGYGMGGFLGLGKQSAFGTPVAAADYVPLMSEGLSEARDRFEQTNIHGALYEPNDVAGVRRVSGDISFSANPETLGFFLQSALGATTVTSLATALAASSFKPRTADASSLYPLDLYTFEINRDVGSSQQYADCMMTRLEFSLAPNQPLSVTAGIIGRSSTNIQATSPTFVSSPVDAFNFSTASLSIGGAATSLIEGLTITLDNVIEGRPSLNNSNTVARLKRGGPTTVRISGNIGFENITEYTNFTNQTKQALTLNLTAADSFSLLIDIPEMVYTAFPLGMGGREYQLVNFEGRANYKVSSATAIEAVLTTVNSEW